MIKLQQHQKRHGEAEEGRRREKTVAEGLLRLGVILSAQAARNLRRRAYADQRGEGDDQQHQRKDDRNGRQPIGADVVADEDAVHDVVQRVRQQPHHGGQRETEDQAGNWSCPHQ